MLKIELDSATRQFRPGEPIAGEVSWDSLPEKTDAVSVRLIWYTQGKGDRDVDVVAEEKFEIAAIDIGNGSQRFNFAAPHRPYSFSGALIELSWSLEAVLQPSRDSAIEKITIGPSGEIVLLNKKFEDALSGRMAFSRSK